ncbi:MAG: hypothetical protein ABIG95_05115 [Candidatus Woesearchaeota archaeon]
MSSHPETSGERAIKAELKYLKIRFEQEKTIYGLKYDSKSYRVADFYLPDFDAFVEFFGQWDSGEHHRQRYREKKKIFTKNGLKCLYLYPSHLKSSGFMIRTFLSSLKPTGLEPTKTTTPKVKSPSASWALIAIVVLLVVIELRSINSPKQIPQNSLILQNPIPTCNEVCKDKCEAEGNGLLSAVPKSDGCECKCELTEENKPKACQVNCEDYCIQQNVFFVMASPVNESGCKCECTALLLTKDGYTLILRNAPDQVRYVNVTYRRESKWFGVDETTFVLLEVQPGQELKYPDPKFAANVGCANAPCGIQIIKYEVLEKIN